MLSATEVQHLPVTRDSTKMMAHLDGFQKIAANNGGNHAVGTADGLATAKYIVNEAKKAGCLNNCTDIGRGNPNWELIFNFFRCQHAQ